MSNELQLDKEFLKKVTSLSTLAEKKDLIQSRAVDLSSSYNHVVLEWATGCGKSLAALKIIKKAVDSGDTTPWFIVCSEINHIDNWISDLVKHKLGYLMEHIEIFCYASLGKYKKRTANLILDESHSVSDLRLGYLSTIDAKSIISLSATLNDDRKAQLMSLRHFRCFSITMTDAINSGILPSPRIYILIDKMNETIKSEVYSKTKGSNSDPLGNETPPPTNPHFKGGFQVLKAKSNNKTIYPTFRIDHSEYMKWLVANKALTHYKLDVECTQKQYYDLLTNNMNYYKKQAGVTGAMWAKNKMLQLGNQRKTYIANSKDLALGSIATALDKSGLRYIAFTGSIEQCDKWGGTQAIHSKIPSKKIAQRIANFNTGHEDNLYAVQMVREGQNLENIDAGIITQLDSEDLSFVQMMGRVFRSTSPILFVMVKDGTQDVTYLNNCMEGLDEKFVKYIEYNSENINALKTILCQEGLKKGRIKEMPNLD